MPSDSAPLEFWICPDIELSDLPRIVEIERECFEPRLACGVTQYKEHLDKWKTFVAMSPSGIIGFVAVEPHTPMFRQKYGYIYTLNVAANCRKQGVGSWLLGAAHNYLYGNGFKRSVLHVALDNPALSLYLKRGYRVFGFERNFYYCGKDALKLEKEL